HLVEAFDGKVDPEFGAVAAVLVEGRALVRRLGSVPHLGKHRRSGAELDSGQRGSGDPDHSSSSPISRIEASPSPASSLSSSNSPSITPSSSGAFVSAAPGPASACEDALPWLAATPFASSFGLVSAFGSGSGNSLATVVCRSLMAR